jgi:hypothetical protein
MKGFNQNGYRLVTVMAFGDHAGDVHRKVQPGSIIALLNPKEMTGREDQGFTYSLETVKNIVVIGYSEDYEVCKGQDRNARNRDVKY